MDKSFSSNFKLIISDFDGTIANSKLIYSQEVRRAILLFIKSGFSFSIATGRPYFGVVAQACGDLGLISPQIVSGGSAIIDPKLVNISGSNQLNEKYRRL